MEFVHVSSIFLIQVAANIENCLPAVCTSSRECIGDQLCIQGRCQPTCKTNTSCPEYQFCQNNICVQELKCYSDDDCNSNEKCLQNTLGQTECIDACSRKICGRNAECASINHEAVCTCKSGFRGNPKDEKAGCKRIECDVDDDCSNDKLCDQNTCKIACLVDNPCGSNAVCSAEYHKQVCYCQPGFTGDPRSGCRLVDFCEDNPCAPGARCHNSRGSFRCTCPTGTVGDPYKDSCKSAVECHTNNDCPPTAECDKSDGIPKCKNTCQNKNCGPNTECIPIDHSGHCTCRNGYEGNPNDFITGCTPKPVSCSSTTDCPSNTYCYGDSCRRKIINF